MNKFYLKSAKELIKVASSRNYSDNEADDLIDALVDIVKSETQPKPGESKGKFIYNKVSNFVNNFNCDEKGFVDAVFTDHRTLQQSFFRLILRVVERFSNLESYQYDGRNESSVRKAKIMIKALKDANESIGCPMI